MVVEVGSAVSVVVPVVVIQLAAAVLVVDLVVVGGPLQLPMDRPRPVGRRAGRYAARASTTLPRLVSVGARSCRIVRRRRCVVGEGCALLDAVCRDALRCVDAVCYAVLMLYALLMLHAMLR